MSAESLVGRTLDGRYRIERIAARGGMATVFLATDLRLQRPVAVKVMHQDLASDPQFVTRFVRESRAAAALAHPNVVAIHDQGQDEGTRAVYIVMELVAGRTLRDVLNERGRLTAAQALAVLDPVLQALSAAHHAGFVHRDIKPENVLISDGGQVKVTDFGLARAVVSNESAALTRGVLIGTAAYLSPEQVETGAADSRSDIYSAGVLLFEMLTGELPHSGETPIAIAFQHVHADVPAASTRVGGLPNAVDELVVRATRRDPIQRYQSAEAMLAEVRRARVAIDGYQPATDFQPASDFQPTTVIAERPARPVAEVVPDSGAGVPAPHQPTTITELAEPRRRTRKLLRSFVALVLIGAAAAGWWFTSGNRTSVPQLTGATLEQAQAALVKAELRADVVRVYSDEVAVDVVMRADPASGTSLARQSTVKLTVSKGPEFVNMIDLVNQTLAQAKAKLAAAGLQIGEISRDYSKTIGKGKVISSNPAAGDQVKPGAKVALLISEGPAPIRMPELSGSGTAAKQRLSDIGFTNITVKRVYSNTVPKGDVISVSPKPTTSVLPDAPVSLTISNGPPPVTVPSTIAMTASKAQSTLTAAKLRSKLVWSNSCGTKKVVNTAVLSQNPDGGAQVPRNSVVTLTVARFCKA